MTSQRRHSNINKALPLSDNEVHPTAAAPCCLRRRRLAASVALDDLAGFARRPGVHRSCRITSRSSRRPNRFAIGVPSALRAPARLNSGSYTVARKVPRGFFLRPGHSGVQHRLRLAVLTVFATGPCLAPPGSFIAWLRSSSHFFGRRPPHAISGKPHCRCPMACSPQRRRCWGARGQSCGLAGHHRITIHSSRTRFAGRLNSRVIRQEQCTLGFRKFRHDKAESPD